jgi:phosphoglycerate dehydrogenase-like enzyme
MIKKKAVYFCAPESIKRVYGPAEKAAIAERLDMVEHLVTRENWQEHRGSLSEAEAIVSSWGGAILDDELLAAMPNLKVYFYGAGTIKELMTDAAWERGVRITNAADANAVPVAEFCLAQILFSLKHGWKYMQLAKADHPQLWQCDKPVPGNYGSNVGIVSLGQIARKTCELLKPFDLKVYASSSYGTSELAKQLGVTFTSIEEIFKTCDVVSIHLPSNERTRNRIGKELLETMKPDSTLINTARGAVIHQAELIEFLKQRPDVTACIDVTEPEPPESGCPLYELDNVVLTPHLAGSMGGETKRLAKYMIEEIDRWLAGEPLKWEITREAAVTMA